MQVIKTCAGRKNTVNSNWQGKMTENFLSDQGCCNRYRERNVFSESIFQYVVHLSFSGKSSDSFLKIKKYISVDFFKKSFI